MSMITPRPTPSPWACAPAAPVRYASPPQGPGLFTSPSRRRGQAPWDDVGTGLRLNGHWPELLSDLGVLGRVRLELTSAVMAWRETLSLDGLRVDGTLATLAGADASLRLLLDHCAALSTSPARDSLALEDDLGRALLHVQPAAPAELWLWRTVLGGIFGGAERVVPLRASAPAPALGALSAHPLGVLQSRCDDGAAAPGFRDTVELTGQLACDPVRLRSEALARGHTAVAVDPALIPCALRSLCEAALPLVMTLGADALVMRRRLAFERYALVQDRVRLTSAAASLELDVLAIDSAWVEGSTERGGGGRQLRLYDADGRALAVIAAAPTACNGEPAGVGYCGCAEPRHWRSLMNALSS